MQLLLAVGGAALGLALTIDSVPVFGLLTGLALGYVIGTVLELRARLTHMEADLAEVRRRWVARDAADASAASLREKSANGPSSVGDEPADARASAADVHAEIGESPTPEPAELHTPEWAPERSFATAQAAQPDWKNARTEEPAWREPALVRMLREYFTGGNTLVRVGIIILFFGVAFLVRYVAERTSVPIEARLLGVALGAIAMLALGWRLRAKRLQYALALQGGGVGVLYVTVFGALKVWEIMPPVAAFTLLVLIVVLAALLAILQDSLELAVLSVVGGFLAPVLSSTGQGNHVVLFSYYALLNAGVVGIAWFKAWRPLNALAFCFTFVIGTVWGVLRYRGELFASTEPFLILFFLYYVALAVLFASRQPPQLRGYVDGSLVFGTPIVAFGLQSAMLRDRPYALAVSALVTGAVYLTLAWTLHRRRGGTYRLLVEAFMALGIVFLTLAVPLALDGRWTAATWALEGAALVWVGCRQNRKLQRLAGALLQVAAGIVFLRDVDSSSTDVPVLNSVYLGGVMVSSAAVFATRMLEHHRRILAKGEHWIAAALFFWGLLWWLGAGSAEISRRFDAPYQFAALLAFVAGTALLSSELVRRQGIHFARWPALSLLPLMVLFTCASVTTGGHPFGEARGLAWLLAFVIFYVVCRRHESEASASLVRALHVGSALLLIGLASWELAWLIDDLARGTGSWSFIAWAVLPAAMLAALPQLEKRLAWPVAAHRDSYAGMVGGIVIFYLLVWMLATNVISSGDPAPLPYVPLLNPLDVAQGVVLYVLIRYLMLLRATDIAFPARDTQQALAITAAGAAFVWINAVLLRTLHYWADVPLDLSAMLASTLVQTALSIFWTLLALTTMLVATRRASRFVWLAGAVLLAVVVAKLFLVDLSRVGTVERIVSFVAVGVLMLVIGYFSPLPPAAREAR